MGMICILIKIFIGSPVFFVQKRIGFRGMPFFIYKFRTMTNSKDHLGNLLSDDQRLTALGSVLRTFSIDELPQLLNVLKGDLSLVGPRPLLEEYVPLYTNKQRKRHDVMPGITGWAQIKGRNSISWEEKFKLDIWYVENQSFVLDLKILLLTLFKVFKREGITTQNNSFMPKFDGKN